MRPARIPILLVLTLAMACSESDPLGKPPNPHPGVAETPVLISNLDGDNFEAWAEYIWPQGIELEWEQIDWLPTFEEGVRRADATGRPVLMWAMNGHPLGCT